MRGKILKGTLILTLSSIVDMGIRLLYQASVASRFGADAAMDAYFAATTVPNLIGEALIGSLSITLIPVFIDYLVHQDKREAWRVVSCICNVTVLILSLTSGLAVALGSQVVRWTVPGFEASRSQLAVHLLRIESWTLPFLALKSLLAGVYYARDEFLIPSLAKALQSTVRVLFVLFFGEFVGVIGIAWADLLGVSVDVAMLLPVWLRRGRFYLTFDLRHPGARRTLSLMLPYVIGAFIGKANPLIARFLASYLSAGSISYLAYAERIKTVAATILGSGITQSIFPTLSAIHSERRYDLLGHTVERAIQWVLYLVLPVVAILVALRVPIVQTMFERGEFSREATIGTALALMGYAPAILTGVLGGITGRTFYAMQDTKTPVIITSAGTVIYFVICLVLLPYLSFFGVALAFSVRTLFDQFCFLLVLSRRLGTLRMSAIARFGVCTLLLAVGAGLVTALCSVALDVPSWSFFPRILMLGILALVGFGVYLATGFIVVPTQARGALRQLRMGLDTIVRKVGIQRAGRSAR